MSLTLCFTGEAGSGEVGSWYGASSVTAIGDLLELEPLDFGPALTEIDLTIHYPLRPGLLQRKGWAKPPPKPKENLRRVHRKKAKLDIRWISLRRSCKNAFSFLKESNTPQAFALDFDDLVDALTYGTGTLKPSDEFDREGFLSFIQHQRQLDRGTPADIRQALEYANDLAKQRWEARDAWDKLSVDWDDMHPNARAILDDPQDWSNSHDFSPHGNDTGADIFADWSVYTNLTPEQAAQEIGWGSDFDLTNALCWKDWIEINLALAFGHIKKRGTCPQTLANSVLDALRQDLSRAKTLSNWEHQSEYVACLTRYIAILERY